jgi:hypothetical protein
METDKIILPSVLLVSTCRRWLSTDMTGAQSSTTSFSLICEQKTGHHSVSNSSVRGQNTEVNSYSPVQKITASMKQKGTILHASAESVETSPHLHILFL